MAMPVSPALLRSAICAATANDRQAAHALRIVTALGEIFLHRYGLRRNIFQRQDAVHGRPVGALDNAMMKIIFGFVFGRSAGDNADCVATNFAALRVRGLFGSTTPCFSAAP